MNKPDANEFNWDELPSDHNYIAADGRETEDLVWYSYNEKPRFDPRIGQWCVSPPGGNYYRISSRSIPEFLRYVAAKDSLRERNGTAGQREPPAQTTTELSRIADILERIAVSFDDLNCSLRHIDNQLRIANEPHADKPKP